MKNFYKEYFRIAKGEKIRDKVILTRMVSSIVVTLFCLVGISLTAYAYFYHNISSGLNIMSSAHFEVEVSVSAQIPVPPDAESNDEENGQPGEISEGAESTEGADIEEPQDDFLTEGSENAVTGEGEAQTEGDIQTEGTPENQAEGEGEAQASIAEETQTDEGMPEEINEEESLKSTIPPEAYSPQLVRLNKKTHAVYLYPDVVYEITLTRSGSAKTGYCYVSAEGVSDVYITGQIGKNGEYTDDTLSFFITVNAETTVKIVSNWGTSSAYDAYINHNPSDFYVLEGNTVNILLPGVEEKKSPESEAQQDAGADENENSGGEIIHTVSDGDSIYLISETYSVSMDRITAYNELSDPSVIHTGDIIKIPPADWVMPETPNEEIQSTPVEEAPSAEPDAEGEAEADTGTEVPGEASNTEGEAEADTETETPDEASNTVSEAESDTKTEAPDENSEAEGEAEADTETETPDETTNSEGEAEASDESTGNEAESDTEAEVSGESSDSESETAEESEPS